MKSTNHRNTARRHQLVLESAFRIGGLGWDSQARANMIEDGCWAKEASIHGEAVSLWEEPVTLTLADANRALDDLRAGRLSGAAVLVPGETPISSQLDATR